MKDILSGYSDRLESYRAFGGALEVWAETSSHYLSCDLLATRLKRFAQWSTVKDKAGHRPACRFFPL